jgi:hypothetical protein
VTGALSGNLSPVQYTPTSTYPLAPDPKWGRPTAPSRRVSDFPIWEEIGAGRCDSSRPSSPQPPPAARRPRARRPAARSTRNPPESTTGRDWATDRWSIGLNEPVCDPLFESLNTQPSSPWRTLPRPSGPPHPSSRLSRRSQAASSPIFVVLFILRSLLGLLYFISYLPSV